jgi:hypothetical protein
MATTRINDDVIWVKNIEGGEELRHRILAMKPGQVIDLEVDGVVGKWARMRTGSDGRPANGIKPIAEMREVWAHLRKRRAKVAAIREVVAADSYLASVSKTLDEWNSAADDEAYRDL